MTISIIGRRYARALFTLATDQDSVASTSKALTACAATFAENSELREVFQNPSFSREVRSNILNDVAAAAKLPESISNTLRLLADRGRMPHLGEVAEAFAAMAETESGRLHAEVTTAAALPESYFSELEKTLKQVTGKDITLTRKTDPDLLGGVVTRIGDQVFDGSLKHRLAGLKDELLR